MNTDDLQARLASDLARMSADVTVPGASVAVVVGAHVVVATSGVVNSRTRVPVTPDSLFQIQSITKILTATLVLQLVDEGLVQLDTPVQAYLPEFHTADAEASRQITVRHLLTHTGGFEGDLWRPTTAGPDALDRFVRHLVTQAPQHSRPGERFSYCNAGFGTLGRLVEVLRGAAYEQALRRHLTDPLGIDELAFSASQALAFRSAIGHVRPAPSAPLRPTREWAVLPPSNPAAGNQLAMSARGLLAVGRLFLTGGRTSAGGRLLSADSVRAMLRRELTQPGAAGEPTYQGLGWQLKPFGVAEHPGGSLGVATILRVAPGHDVGAVVLTNSDAGGTHMRQLLDPLFAELLETMPSPPPAAAGVDARVGDPSPFLGRYATRQTLFEVTKDRDGRLWMGSQPQNESVTMADRAGIAVCVRRQEIRPLENDTFVLIDDDGQTSGTVTFYGQRDGRFTFLTNGRTATRAT